MRLSRFFRPFDLFRSGRSAGTCGGKRPVVDVAVIFETFRLYGGRATDCVDLTATRCGRVLAVDGWSRKR